MTTCAQPGCGGTIQDGYCDTCGLAAAAPSYRTRSSRRTSGRSARGRLGAGLVEIPPVPHRDPASAVLANPQVPENKRYCSGCDQPVGRDTGGSGLRPGLTEGFCRNCGTRFSFSPKLEPGEEVAGQYEVLGCLAQPAGYIVMEYVGGKSLKQILVDARASGGSVPVAHAIAYAVEVLPALGYLHDRGLVYCDFKPDNVIQTEEQLKLIDMGGVRGVDSEGPIYGTVGYQAPEIGAEGPSVSSDLFTVARALAVLTFEFRGYQSNYKFTFPDAVPLLEQQESFARLLRRATHPDPERRFGSAGEMAEQLTGVLREVLATADGTPRPAFSTVFSPELQAVLAGGDETLIPLGGAGPPSSLSRPPRAAEIIAGMPMPQVDRADPAAGYLATFAGLDSAQRAAALSGAVSADAAVPAEVATSAETRLALARAQLDVGDYNGAGTTLADLAAEDPTDWRVAWTGGLRQLAAGEADTDGTGAAAAARGAFSAVFDELPGELAPKLALAFASEAAGDAASAVRYFKLVWTVDRSCISAAFGLARACLVIGDRPGAIAALAAVPETSSYHAAAQITAVRILVSSGMTDNDLQQASGRLGRLALDEARRQQLTVEILRAALGWSENSGRAPARIAGDGLILGCEPNERSLRFGLERGYRALARLTSDRSRRIELVDMANAVRPKTWS